MWLPMTSQNSVRKPLEFRIGIKFFGAVLRVFLELLQGRLRVSYVITENTTRRWRHRTRIALT